MWRTLSKFRKSFGAFPSVSNDTHSPLGQNSNHQIVQTSAPALNTFGSRHYFKCCCGSSKGEGHRDHRARQGGPFYQVKHDWLDAVGWSGVLLFSWFLCQPYCVRRRVSTNPAERYAFQRLASSGPSYHSLVECVSKLVLDTSAKYVLPTVRAVKSRNPSPTVADRAEALQNGCDSLGVAHEKVTSSLSNFLGTECMQTGKHEEAFGHFSEAAQADNSSAIFNLGICFEMGFGTKQCFNRAAELYRKASDLGHATAMYNLGVFYVHGWGGVQADGREAHQLFTAAAKLGQLDAKRALHCEDHAETEQVHQQPEAKDSCFIDDSDELFLSLKEVEPKNNDLTDLWFKALNINLDGTEKPLGERLSSVDSGVNDLSPTGELHF